MPAVLVQPVVDRSVLGLCRRPYPGHRKGCPNFRKKPGCPPGTRMVNEMIDLNEPVHAVFNRFPIGEHAARMRGLHPEWSDRQAYCCLYWQPRARQQLRGQIRSFLDSHPGQHVIACPEAQGVNLTATMRGAGIELEWPPREWAYQIVLAGVPINTGEVQCQTEKV